MTRLQAELDLEQARLRMRQAKRRHHLGRAQRYNALQDAHRRLAVAEQRLAEMEENWRVVQALFDARMATDVEILQGQTGLAEARTSAVNAVFDYNVARAEFFQAIAERVGSPMRRTPARAVAAAWRRAQMRCLAALLVLGVPAPGALAQEGAGGPDTAWLEDRLPV